MENTKKEHTHSFTVENRKEGRLTGVREVDSFHDREILLLTEGGKLQIKGEQLHIKGLNLEKGEAFIEGRINSFSYAAGAGSGKKKDRESLLKRLFR